MNPTRKTVLGLLTVLLLGAGVPPAAAGNDAAAPPPPDAGAPQALSPSLSDLGRSLRSYFTEEELDTLFQYMRDSVVAAFKDEEVTLPPDLAFKLEVLLARMKKEGGHYMDNLIKQLEKDLERNLKEKLKEKLAPPDTSKTPYMPPQPILVIPFFIPQATLPQSPVPPASAPNPYLPRGYVPSGQVDP
jgi:hypothetical protein